MASRPVRVMIGDELMHPGDFLYAEDLKGRDVNLTISEVVKEEVFIPKANERKPAPVLKFNGTKKKFICNKTNAATIAGMYGAQAKEWAGKKITLYPTTCKVGKATEPCIRIRPKPPGAKADDTHSLPADPPPHDESEPCAPGKSGCDEAGTTREGVYWCAKHDPANRS